MKQRQCYRIFQQCLGIVLLSFLSFAALAAPVQLIGVRTGPPSLKTRIVFTFSGIPKYTTFTLNNPARLVIDLQNTELHAKLDPQILKGLPVTSIHSAAKPHQILRVVLQLQQAMHQDVFTLPATQPYGERLVVDLSTIEHATPSPTAAPTISSANQPAAPKTTEKPRDKMNAKASASAKPTKTAAAAIAEDSPAETTAPPITSKAPPKAVSLFPLKRRNIVVVIDPGHGGKDPGASGINGTHEKHVVLAISKELQRLLQKEPGMRGVLTRGGDYYIGLRERLKLARKDKADMFIAIHADAFNNPYSSGSSVFALSASGASSEAARWLAEKENYSELGGVHLEDKNNVLRSVLIDLSQTGTISLSLQLGRHLLDELGQISRLHHGRKVEQARFVVLKSPDIPSVLVETGFISNEKEEARLSDPIFQHRLAEALMAGIRRYFIQYPPPGTILASQRDG